MKKILLVVGFFIVLLFVALFVYEKYFDKSYLQPSDSATKSIPGVEFHNPVSQKPRDKVISYTVVEGETISSVAEKFGISTNTVKWANNLSSDKLTPGQILQILPVTGIAHTVMRGDIIESLAAKYHTTTQKIIDFPFNNFADPQAHKLIVGETIIIPDGSM